MKNVFGIYNENDEVDGKDFIIRKVNPIIAQKLDEIKEDPNGLKNKASIPLYLRIIRFICFILGFMITIVTIGNLGELSLKEMYNNAPYLYYALGVFILFYTPIKIYEVIKRNKVIKSGEVEDLKTETENIIELALNDLGIPKDSKYIDVLTFSYKIKDGKEKPIAPLFQYLNFELHLFRENDNLCLATVGEVYAFPIANIKKIKEINKRITVGGWNKEEAYNSKEYNKYKIVANNMGILFYKQYYSIVISKGDEDFEILVPNYDIESILEITNLDIEKEEVNE